LCRVTATIPTVLIVEDHPLVRSLTADGLTANGFHVIEAEDAAEALRTLDMHEDVHVLFTDVRMPGEMDGLALADRVAQKRPDVEVIVTSGGEAARCADLPPNGTFLQKPYLASQLAALIRERLHDLSVRRRKPALG
jgi:two-component system, response regulator PdtaR